MYRTNTAPILRVVRLKERTASRSGSFSVRYRAWHVGDGASNNVDYGTSS